MVLEAHFQGIMHNMFAKVVFVGFLLQVVLAGQRVWVGLAKTRGYRSTLMLVT